MKLRWICALAGALCLSAAFAQAPQRVERADQLPRFSYPVQGELEAIVRDPQRFAALARDVRRDTESILAKYDIAELAMRRQLLGQLVQLDLLEARWDDALRRTAQIQQLQEKPADKLLSGLTVRAIAAAIKKTGERNTPAYAAEVGRFIAAELEPLPYIVIRNDIRRAKAGSETIGEALALGRVRNVLQPVATRTGALSSDLVPSLISARYVLEFVLPLKPTLIQTYTHYLAARKIDKPDIWAARDVALPAGRNYATVPVVVWDSGVDTPLFPGRTVGQGGAPAMIAFDRFSLPSSEPLKPIPAELRSRLESLLSRSKGLSDLTSDIDSLEATEVKTLLSTLAPTQYKTVIEELRLVGVYEHGTHVAGIAMAGNPYARIANARIEFGHTLLPDPCPTRELEERTAATFGAYADFIRKSGARVVNMSWGGTLRSYEVELEQCGVGKDSAERKALARQYFDLHHKALTAAMASLPDVLFVTSAGNSGDDPTFNDAYPSGIVLPNLVSVGAVDQAGDEASFTSYGPTVLLHANGYQVESVVPGGRRVALSGTSMASPQVTNLAAKMLAVKPSLKPAEIISIMRSTADRTEDGRRTLIHPAKALAAVGYAPGSHDIAVEKDVSIHVVDGGDRNAKTTILFVPGWGMSTAVWRDTMAAFASRARVVSIDPRSQGFSTLTPRGNTPERRAQDLHEVIKALSLGNVVLVGWSQGVQDVAAYAAAFAGDRIAGYVLVDSTLGAGPAAAMTPASDMQEQLERMSVYARFPREYLKGMMTAIIRSPAGRARIEEFVEVGLRTPPDIGVGMLMTDFILIDRRPALKKFNRPTLVIAADSPDAKAQREMAQQIPGARFETIADAGHAVFLDQPKRFDELLANFLARLGG